MKNISAITLPVESQFGIFIVRYSERGLAGLEFPSAKNNPKNLASFPMQVSKWHALTVNAVNAVLSGRTAGELPPLDVSC